MFVIPSELDAEDARLRRHTVRHEMVVVFANYGGPTGGLSGGGGSAIYSEEGQLVGRLGRNGAGVVVATRTAQAWHAVALPAGRG